MPPYLVDKADSIALKHNAKEIIKFNYDIYSEKQKYPQEGFFINKQKKYPAKLFSKYNTIYRENEYLIFPNGTKYNTYDILNNFGGNQLLSAGIGKIENRVVLKYNHSSNHNACGFCGADPGEEGYRMLTFDKNWKLKNIKEFAIYSCLSGIYSYKKLDSKKQNLLVYHVDTDGLLPTVRPYRITVNLDQAFVAQTEL